MNAIAKYQTTDTLDRPIRDLRVSVTDRCNFRCIYCMPREIFGSGYKFVPRNDLLTLEEIARITRLFAGHGVRKVRITGGEPMIRRNLVRLIEMLRDIDGITDISMTTNASMLTLKRAQSLRAAGLSRINISLDAIDEQTFQRVNDVDFPVAKVLEGIDNAHAAGFDAVKVNAVIRRGYNEHSILPLAQHFHGTGTVLRFIEFMDVGTTNKWNLEEVVPAAELMEIIGKVKTANEQSEFKDSYNVFTKEAGGPNDVLIIVDLLNGFACMAPVSPSIAERYTSTHGEEAWKTDYETWTNGLRWSETEILTYLPNLSTPPAD